ncbi:phage baseplate protein [Pseudovibrio exalbescens]|uniref:phage baseplate protein n=1 Tax=Pseudovibrio exalbescens TaxID=197461 RepID=UPI00236551AE|nr:phage baseplate protein [Pseudovibrio exalbescens]MDD7908647.1 phage baseplate protein [Pseudovibrio exalbescens]
MVLDPLHWQIRLAQEDDAPWNEAAIGLDDLAQSIRLICLTPKLSVPTEPEQFCDALSYVDRVPAEAIPGISKEVWEGISRWEPRVLLDRVDVAQAGFAYFTASIYWRPRSDVLAELQRTDVDLMRVA